MRRAGAGVSLVELMVALGVGVVVVMGLTQMLAGTNATYAREEQFARLQENGRIAATLVAKLMRPNRSTDCKSIAMHQASNSFIVKACDLLQPGSGAPRCTGDHVLGPDRALGYDGSEDLSDKNNFHDLPSIAADNVAARWVRGDVLVTWGVDPDGAALNGPLGGGRGGGAADGTGRINLTRVPSTLDIGSLALVSNCQYAHVLEVSGPANLDRIRTRARPYIEHGGGSNATNALRVSDVYPGSAPYNRDGRDPRAMLYPLVYRVFYVCCSQNGNLQSGNTVSKCRPNSGDYDPEQFRPALCVFDLQTLNAGIGGESQVLVPDIADLRVTYTGNRGGNLAGEIDFRADDRSPVPTAAWVSANNAWAGVRSASVEFLLTTEAAHAVSGSAAPARDTWPPNAGGGSIDPDTLGAGYPADERLYHRFRFDVALRATTPWNLRD
jgi:hypothetical protein